MKITTILSALVAATLVSAGKFHQVKTGKTNILPNAFIIEYEKGVTHADAHTGLHSHAVDYKVRNEYNIFNGASITVNSGHDGHALAKIPGVKNVWHVSLYSAPKTEKVTAKKTDPLATSDHHMTGVDVLQEKYKLTGKGIKIGVIDTGIDYNHPAFAAKGATKGCFARNGKNCRIAHGWDFVGDAYTGYNTPVPGDDPMDCFGHGTHVAGIIGGNAMDIKVNPKPPRPFIGVAPEVTYGAYRIFGCNGSSGEDVILAAMELAFNDGMDIINMSLGGGSAYKDNPTAALAETLIAKGMALSGAAGNDGASGIWMVSDTGLGDHATSVASFDNMYDYYNYITYGGVKMPFTVSEAYAKPITLPNTLPIVPLLDAKGNLLDGCDPAQYTAVGSLKNKIVVALGDITRCLSGGRGANAQKAGATGMIIVSDDVGIDSLGGVAGLPMASISNADGMTMLATYAKNKKDAVSWSKDQGPFIIDNSGAPSSFSSFGLDGDLRSKPDIGAPGGNILSTYPLALGGYTLMSGTSMATPYIAGSHALYMQAKHAKPLGGAIRLALKNTATISKNWQSKTFTSAAKQGAGLVNVLNAVLAEASITPDHIDLLDSINFQKTVHITLKNIGKHTETYTLKNVPADGLISYLGNNTWPLGTPEIEATSASVTFSQEKVKIPGGKSAKITLHFKEPKTNSLFPMYSGFVVATPKTKGAVAVHVPYIGMKGDVRKVPIMDTDHGFPQTALANSTTVLGSAPANPYTYDLVNNFPAFISRFGSHTPNAEVRVLDSKKKFVGYISFGESGRQPLTDENGNPVLNEYIWNGQVQTIQNATAPAITVPAGTYTIVFAQQHKFSKGEYPKDFEIFTMDPVTIA
ncbi:hypothetical protein EMPS_10768 [Entomortierella parvispora]|uniref:Peptidase S8/S53 domain-containing protein n=1 Tax=Entomortierella parvispora TaxID=205924 RepID=A0A9P3HKE5_9FUNG|nr:hypothetical protein EMPS_10768 [Entomortierella parvispora]